MSGFALKDSDVNMTITEYESPMVLRSLFDVLKADESGMIGSWGSSRNNYCQHYQTRCEPSNQKSTLKMLMFDDPV